MIAASYPTKINKKRRFRVGTGPSPRQQSNDQHDPLMVRVYIFDVDSGDEIRCHEFNYMDHEARRQINKLSLWALHNNKAVEFINVKDDYSE
jgi:hypothetical protein